MDEHARPFRRSERHPAVRLLFSMNRCFGRIYHHVNVLSPCRLPRSGPAILICNHLSGVDPILVQACCPRVIRWMMAEEYYAQKSLRWMLDIVGTIPVERNGRDTAATRAALQALKDGYVLGVFPEGKIEIQRQLLPFQPGLALLAMKSGAPVYPVCMEGSQRGKNMLPAYFFPQSAILTFGEPRILARADRGDRKLEVLVSEFQNDVELLRIKIKNCGIIRQSKSASPGIA